MVEIVEAKPEAPSKFLIIGEPFSGKTTLAAKAPKPLFVSTDGNAAKAGLSAVNVKTFKDVVDAVALGVKDERFETVVIDTVEGVVDIMTKEVIDKANEKGEYGEVKALSDVPYGKLTGELNAKIQSFAEFIARVDKNVVILSYSKRQMDETSGSMILASELKNIRFITRFIDVQVLTHYDGEKYDARVIGKRDVMAGEAELGGIESFLTAIGYSLPKRKTKLGGK